jgi:hypothetical protein
MRIWPVSEDFPVTTNYKVSYVVKGGQHPGAILNTDHRPLKGDRVKFTVLEVIDLMPPRGDFQFLHVTLEKAEN